MSFETGDLICIKFHCTVFIWELGARKRSQRRGPSSIGPRPGRFKLQEGYSYYGIYLGSAYVCNKHHIAINNKCYVIWTHNISPESILSKVET